jgi:ketosteroid isomerase-like protein
VWRDWYEADERVIVEIRERSWLRSAPEDRMDQRTCVVIRFRDGRICEMRDYTDAALYEAFLARHRAGLPKFSGRPEEAPPR